MNTYYATHHNRKIVKGLIFMLSALLALTIVLPALASDAYVTSGDFNTFADGITRGYEISGHARMTRTGDDKTLVSVHATGLAANASYNVHVHAQACSNNNAGGHYKYDPAGPVDAYNEIWPVFTTNAAGIGNGNAKNTFYASPAAMSVVIHDTTDGKKIACADLQ